MASRALAINALTPDVTCEEVCVCCFKVFRRTSEFIRHAREHSGATETKRKYMEQIAAELRRLADKEIYARLANQKKRTWEEAALNLEEEVHDLNLPGVEARLPISTNPPEYLCTADVTRTTSGGMATVSAPPPVAGTMNTNTLDIAAQSYPRMEQPSHILDDHQWDPPLFMHLNFPSYPVSIDDWLVSAPD